MIRALVLGVVQGLTEFLPISSSAHLVLVPYFAGWPKPDLAFDVALHLGTLAAVIWHFRADLAALAVGLLGGGEERRLISLLAVASVPVATAGMLLESSVEQVFTEPMWTAGLMLVMAMWLEIGERSAAGPAPAPAARPVEDRDDAHRRDPGVEMDLQWSDAMLIGLAQASALLPGISRSGSTIATGLLRGVDRQTAARFSFLLSIPAIAGAIMVQVPDLASGQVAAGDVAVGVVAAFLSGLWAIRWLLRIISTRGLTAFAVYLAMLACVVLITGQA